MFGVGVGGSYSIGEDQLAEEEERDVQRDEGVPVVEVRDEAVHKGREAGQGDAVVHARSAAILRAELAQGSGLDESEDRGDLV